MIYFGSRFFSGLYKERTLVCTDIVSGTYVIYSLGDRSCTTTGTYVRTFVLLTATLSYLIIQHNVVIQYYYTISYFSISSFIYFIYLFIHLFIYLFREERDYRASRESDTNHRKKGGGSLYLNGTYVRYSTKVSQTSHVTTSTHNSTSCDLISLPFFIFPFFLHSFLIFFSLFSCFIFIFTVRKFQITYESSRSNPPLPLAVAARRKDFSQTEKLFQKLPHWVSDGEKGASF